MKKLLAIALSLLFAISVLASCDVIAVETDGTAESGGMTETDGITETDSMQETDSTSESGSLQEDGNEICGTYIRPNDNYHDSFRIDLYPNGTYQYYETLYSSHWGNGEYTVDGNVITLVDDEIPTYEGRKTYYFKFEYRDGKLIYLAEGSNNFMYIHLPDGAEFKRAPQTES